MHYNGCIKEVAKELDLPIKYVNNIYKGYWKEIVNHIKNIDFKDGLTREEFNALRPNINIPHIGKFYVTYENYLHIQEGKKKQIQKE